MQKSIRRFDLLAPRERVRSLRWFEENIFEPNELRPFNGLLYPHIGAPGGPCDMLDDPFVLEIWMQWASRLGKTMFGQCAQLFLAATNPAPMMFASASQKLAVDVTNRTYRMLDNCAPLKKQVRPEGRRRQDLIELGECLIHVAWSRSVPTLSDKGIKYGHASEIDKWMRLSTATEADPLKLFDDRFKEYSTYKRIKEGTPSVKGRSRVERGRLAGTNCMYNVPCPKCETYQELNFGGPDEDHGVKWEKLENGRSDRQLAYNTAYYKCINSCRIENHERAPMMRRGVWVPEGCGVDADGAKAAVEEWQQTDGIPWKGWDQAPWITGTPIRPGRSATYQLSSLCALAGLNWGSIAAEFIEVKDKPGDLQNFVNQWKGETWEILERKQTWEQLGERIIADIDPRIVPMWASLVTIGIDRQVDMFVYVVNAWGPDRCCHTVEYGDVGTFEELRGVIEDYYHHEDGKEPLQPAITLIDSGYRPQGIYEFSIECNRRGTRAFPCKGSSTAIDVDVKQSLLGKNTSMPGMMLFTVDTVRTQAWMDHVLHDLHPGDAGGMSLHTGKLHEHQDYLEQLLNEAVATRLDSTNHERDVYERIDTNVPNDYRDCQRYAYAAMVIATRNRPVRARSGERPRKRHAVLSTGIKNDRGSWR